jgi:hypothetical protein
MCDQYLNNSNQIAEKKQVQVCEIVGQPLAHKFRDALVRQARQDPAHPPGGRQKTSVLLPAQNLTEHIY